MDKNRVRVMNNERRAYNGTGLEVTVDCIGMKDSHAEQAN
jgi:hypothetical protein